MAIANPYEQKTETERLLHGIIESSINGIMAFTSIRDENGIIVDFRTVALNNVAAAIIQREKSEVLEMTMLEFHPGNQTTGLLALYRECVDHAEPKRIKQYYAEDGINAWFDISAVPNGDGLVITFADITEEERIKHQLLSYQTQLERSNKELENFVCIASHDLQEPLRKVRLFGDRLNHALADNGNAEVSDYIRRMQDAAARMQTLIADLLKLSRLKYSEIEMGMIDLNHVVKNVCETLGEQISKTDAYIQTDRLPLVFGNEIQLNQLFQNLLTNSLKYKRDSVKPEIRIEASQTRRMDQNLKEKSYWQISVIDNGIGFDNKFAHRIFKVFERLHGRTTYNGTGIGLAICERIISFHDGIIEGKGQPGKGATFNIYLPA